MIENNLIFESDSVNKIKMNHIKTMLCGHFIGIYKLERLKFLKNDPLVCEFNISVKEPETVSIFLGKFNFKTTQMFREINFKVFKKLLSEAVLISYKKRGNAKNYIKEAKYVFLAAKIIKTARFVIIKLYEKCLC